MDSRTRPRKLRALLAVGISLGSLLQLGCGGDDVSISLNDLRAPAPVENVAARAGDRRVRLTWDASAETDLLGYNILRANTGSGPFSLIGSVGRVQAPFFQDLGPDLDSNGIPDGLVNGQRYFYRVSPFDARGREPQAEQNTTISAVPGILPGGVTNFGIQAIQAYGGDERVILTWSLNLDSQVFGYNVYRSEIASPNSQKLLAMIPQGTNHFVDEGVSREQDYRYEVAPVTREFLEGQRLRSRIVRVQEGDATIPKFPGHDLATAPVQLLGVSDQGVTISWGRPTENTDGSILGFRGTLDDLQQGGYIVYRSRKVDGRYFPVGIVEIAGDELVTTFLDPQGTPADFYTVRAFDDRGNLSAQSRRISASTNVAVPDVVRGVDAFASTAEGQILVQWVLEPTATTGYRVYRSDRLDGGYRPVSGVLPPTVTFFTDSSSDLTLGRTLYYKVAGVAADTQGALLEGNASVAAPAVSGPTDGVFRLEAEDATVLQVSSPLDFDATSRQGFPDPFSGQGALFIDPSVTAVAGVARLVLQWSLEIDASGGAAGGARTYDVYISSIRNSSAGIFDMRVRESVQDNPEGTTGAILQVQAKDFFTSQFGFPPRPTLERLGSITFTDSDLGGGIPTNEQIDLTLVYQGFNPGIAAGNGELFLDALILVRR